MLIQERTAETRERKEVLPQEEWRERAKRTWDSLQPFFYPNGLAADRKGYFSDGLRIERQTKPTNIGLGLLAILGAAQLEFISSDEAESRLRTVLESIAALDRVKGFFLDWYDGSNAQRLAAWPPNGGPVRRFLSAVDNAWMAASLILTKAAKPQFSDLIDPVLEGMDFSLFFDETTQELRGGFEVDQDQPTDWHYGREFMSEARIVHYAAAALAKTPGEREKILKRLLNRDGQAPDSTFGGSLFEQLAPTLLFDEPYFQAAHRREIDRHRQESHPDGWWGLSPCDDPNTGKYNEFGVGRFYQKAPIIAPYSLFLALKFEPEAVSEILTRLEKNYKIYQPEGYRDSVDVDTGKIADSQLFLDQSMILLAAVNRLRSDYFPRLTSSQMDK